MSTNIYNIPDQEYYMRRYINDLPDPILNIEREFNEENLNNWADAIQLSLASSGLPSACPESMSPVTCFTDNFNRSDSNSLGGTWIELLHAGANNVGYTIKDNKLARLRPTAGNVGAAAGMSGDFAADTTFQSSQLVYRDIEFTGTPVQATSNFGGPCVRMKQVGATLTWISHVAGYILDYTVTHGTGASPSLSNPRLEIWHVGPLGLTSLVSSVLLSSPLIDGDILKLTAANFMIGATTLVCLKGYLNGTLKIQRNNIAATNTKITEGRPGFGTYGTANTQFVRLLWDDWQGCIETP